MRLLTLLMMLVMTPAAWALPSQTPLTTWVPDGAVTDVARVGNQLLLAGRFEHAGPPTGSTVVVRRTDATVIAGAFPRVVGDVSAVESDGAGGWFVAGSFRLIGGVPIAGLAHVRADGTVDPAFDPKPFSFTGQASITQMTLAGGVLYIVGDIRGVGPGIARDGVAALDPTTGSLLPFNPQFVGSPSSIAVVAGRVFVGGEFSSVDDASRNSLAAFDTTTGLLLPWDAGANGNVVTLVADGTQLLVGGFFTRIGGAARQGLAALDATTALATGWAPVSRLTEARLIATDADTVYVWGREDDAGVRAIRRSDGTVRWSAAGSLAEALAVDGSRVLVGTPDGMLAYDAATGARLGWNPLTRGSITAIAPRADGVLVAGRFATVGGVTRHSFAAIDLETGLVTGRDLRVRGGFVTSLFRADGRTYLAGTFTRIDGKRRLRIAALGSGLRLAAWNASANRDVTDIVSVGGRVIVSGQFGVKRPKPFLAFSARTARPFAGWGTDSADQGSATLRVNGGRLYAIAFFASNGETPVELSLTTGHRVQYLIKKDRRRSSIRDIAFVGHRVYLGGSFIRMDGKPRVGLAAISLPSRALTSWRPTINSSVTDLAASKDAVYVTGSFTTAGSQERRDIAAFDPRTGRVLPWAPVLQDDGFSTVVDTLGDVVVIHGTDRGPNLLETLLTFR